MRLITCSALLLLLSAALAAQTQPAAQAIKPNASDSVLVTATTASGARMATFATICGDSTGATCPAGTLYLSRNDMGVTELKASVPAASGGPNRWRVQNVVVTADAATFQITLTEASYTRDSMTVSVNGLVYSDFTGNGFTADYALAGTTLTINRRVSAGDYIRVKYQY